MIYYLIIVLSITFYLFIFVPFSSEFQVLAAIVKIKMSVINFCPEINILQSKNFDIFNNVILQVRQGPIYLLILLLKKHRSSMLVN